jgi:hypothetical protein
MMGSWAEPKCMASLNGSEGLMKNWTSEELRCCELAPNVPPNQT